MPRVRSHSVTCHPAQVTFTPLIPQPKLVLDSATPEGVARAKADVWRVLALAPHEVPASWLVAGTAEKLCKGNRVAARHRTLRERTSTLSYWRPAPHPAHLRSTFTKGIQRTDGRPLFWIGSWIICIKKLFPGMLSSVQAVFFICYLFLSLFLLFTIVTRVQ